MANDISQRCLGLIGGLGVGATVHYYRELAKAHQACGSAVHLVMVQAEMPRVLAAFEPANEPGLPNISPSHRPPAPKSPQSPAVTARSKSLPWRW